MIIIQKNLEFYSNFLPAVNDDGAITNFTSANATTNSFNLKVKLTGQTGNYSTKYVEIIIPLKYFSNFWRGLKMHLINCEITANHSYGGY